MNPANDYNEKSISIQELFVLMKRYLALIIVVGILGGAVAFCVCRFMVSPVYEASAKMIVNSRQEQTGTVTNDQITSAQKLVDTYAIIVRSRPVLEPVIEHLDLTISVDKLASMVTVTPVNDTQVMQIAVRSTNAEQALQIVEQIVEICPAIIIEAVEAGSVKTIEPAYMKTSPVAPNSKLFAVVATLLAMVITVIVVILRFAFDNTYKSESDLRNDLDLPVLGVIPDYRQYLKKKKDSKEGKPYGQA